jgi:hypothetical protein
MTKLRSGRRTVLWFGAAASICCALGSAARAEDDAASRRDRMPPRAGRRPPPEAFQACEGKNEGAECKVTFRGQTLDGVCITPPDEQPFCMPNDMPPPPEGAPPGRIVM